MLTKGTSWQTTWCHAADDPSFIIEIKLMLVVYISSFAWADDIEKVPHLLTLLISFRGRARSIYVKILQSWRWHQKVGRLMNLTTNSLSVPSFLPELTCCSLRLFQPNHKGLTETGSTACAGPSVGVKSVGLFWSAKCMFYYFRGALCIVLSFIL